jgi:hypothetical protein
MCLQAGGTSLQMMCGVRPSMATAAAADHQQQFAYDRVAGSKLVNHCEGTMPHRSGETSIVCSTTLVSHIASPMWAPDCAMHGQH